MITQMQIASWLKSQWNRRHRWLRTLFRLVLILFAGFCGYFASFEFESHNWGAAAFWMAYLTGTALVEFVLADFITEQVFPPSTIAVIQRLEARLVDANESIQVQVENAIDSLRGCDKSLVSGSVHLLIHVYDANDEVEPAFVQIVDYQGQMHGRRWRVFSAAKGIIGRCFRTETYEYGCFASDEDFDHRMVSEFGYTKDDLANITRNGKSYWEHPIMNGRRILGVLFLFSPEPSIFPFAVQTSRLTEITKNILGLLRTAGVP